MNKFALALAILFCLKVTAQTPENSKEIFNLINQDVLHNTEAYNNLKNATEQIGHRLTGSENGQKAEQYAYDLLQSYGLDEVTFQPFMADSWSRESLRFKIKKGSGDFEEIKAVSLAHSPEKVSLTGDIVDMGSGTEADYLADVEKAKDKIVLAYLGVLPDAKEGTKNLHRSEKTALAIKYGAKGVILYNTVPGGVLLTGTASVTGSLIPIPAICIGLEDGLALKENLVGKDQLTAAIDMTNHAGKITARNVVARIKGDGLPDEKIVIGGHLDSWDLATGAIDNGIGSFAVIDMARTLKKLDVRPKRTIEFVLFMGEEEGLLGSKAYVERAIADKSIDHIKYMLNYDMTNDPKSFQASTEESRALFESIGAEVKSIDTTFKNNFEARAGLHSDHQPFMLEGIPTGGGGDSYLSKDVLNCYHADCDSFDLVDKNGIKNTVRFNAMLAFGLANAGKITAKKLSDEEVKDLMIKNNLEEALRISGDWKW
ncbi:M20/M25/M40 family metallo-hydrolase [Olivibacter sp. SDN3]|uniref:M20/M25/M40 family metallo-hydrolase n=1 Tax=Olivibacter sp. SDN3 TaxID=2764720 RepID=UPI0016513936|nr:M20/M25/M40 family metallo-hydrolase [Olivibacter sp. SDN3]QNL50828.1 M20/M25/M40 family metallo-hydrolase [Olivibacter sp. SDN3]